MSVTIESEEKSGRILLRLPKSMHAMLIAESEAESTSLNQLILTKVSLPLAAALGYVRADAKEQPAPAPREKIERLRKALSAYQALMQVRFDDKNIWGSEIVELNAAILDLLPCADPAPQSHGSDMVTLTMPREWWQNLSASLHVGSKHLNAAKNRDGCREQMEVIDAALAPSGPASPPKCDCGRIENGKHHMLCPASSVKHSLKASPPVVNGKDDVWAVVEELRAAWSASGDYYTKHLGWWAPHLVKLFDRLLACERPAAEVTPTIPPALAAAIEAGKPWVNRGSEVGPAMSHLRDIVDVYHDLARPLAERLAERGWYVEGKGKYAVLRNAKNEALLSFDPTYGFSIYDQCDDPILAAEWCLSVAKEVGNG